MQFHDPNARAHRMPALANDHSSGVAKKPQARLENWRMTLGGRLDGNVYGHPHFTDGERVLTGFVLTITSTTAETANTKYVLGRVRVYVP